MKRIPFTIPNLSSEDIQAVVDVLQSGWITSGKINEELSAYLMQYLSAHKVFLTNSATASMFLALKAMGIGEGDEVITTPYTFAATANVIYHTGATPVFADVKKDSFFLDIDEVYKKITPKTKAIIPVDYSTAYPWDIDHQLISQKFTPNNIFQEQLNRPLILIDGAHSLGSRFLENKIDMVAYSFHAVKNLTTAEGGALAINSLGDASLDKQLYKTISTYLLHGQDKSARDKFLSGAWEYDIFVPGYKFNMPDTLAALGLSQLKRYDSTILPARRQRFSWYKERLQSLPSILMNDSNIFEEIQTSSCHLVPIRIKNISQQQRNSIIKFANSKGVMMNVHFKPLHLMSANQYYQCHDLLLNSVEQYSNQISLPLHLEMTERDIDYVVDVLKQGLNNENSY